MRLCLPFRLACLALLCLCPFVGPSARDKTSLAETQRHMVFRAQRNSGYIASIASTVPEASLLPFRALMLPHPAPFPTPLTCRPPYPPCRPSHPPAHLDTCVDGFLSSMAPRLAALTPAELATHVAALTASKMQRDRSLVEEAGRLWGHVASQR